MTGSESTTLHTVARIDQTTLLLPGARTRATVDLFFVDVHSTVAAARSEQLAELRVCPAERMHAATMRPNLRRAVPFAAHMVPYFDALIAGTSGQSVAVPVECDGVNGGVVRTEHR
jgi:hypothetical protein